MVGTVSDERGVVVKRDRQAFKMTGEATHGHDRVENFQQITL